MSTSHATWPSLSRLSSAEMSRLSSITLRASGIARRHTEKAGAPLSWTSERVDTLFVGEGVRKAAAHERQPQRAERAMYKKRAEAFFLSLIARCRSLRIALGKPPTLSSLADERRVGSLLRSTAARDPVRATTTAAGSERDARAASQYSA